MLDLCMIFFDLVRGGMEGFLVFGVCYCDDGVMFFEVKCVSLFRYVGLGFFYLSFYEFVYVCLFLFSFV